jgi:hypothetical protein
MFYLQGPIKWHLSNKLDMKREITQTQEHKLIYNMIFQF